MTSPVTMAASSVNNCPQMALTGANQPGRTIPFGSIAESSVRAQEVNKASVAVQHIQLHVPVPEHVDFTSQTTNHVNASDTLMTFPTITQSARTGAVQVTTSPVVSVSSPPVVSLVGADGTRQSMPDMQAAGVPEPVLNPREEGDNQMPPDTPTPK
ncbi:MAG: hypothetical protein AB2661_20065, partial [Candidatus Thiodiazotropha sp.]